MNNSYSAITEYVQKLADLSCQNNNIKPEMYSEHSVKRGLRDLDGKGVVTGLTEISSITSKKILPDGTEEPCDGVLCYRGYNIKDLVNGFMGEKRFGFEETIYLLLFSELPTKEQLKEFKATLADFRSLPTSFVRDMILKAPGKDLMNILSRSVLALYAYDDNADDISIPNVLRQSLFLISVFPMLSVYGYQSYQHYHNGKSLFIHMPDPELSTAENILHLLREDSKYSSLEARMLDLALVLHAEHGGGNIKVVKMFDDMISNIDIKDEDAIRDYLERLLDKNAFDNAGLIYGMGHAVYSKSDPRADILMKCARDLSIENGYEDEYKLYETVARIAPQIIAEKRKIYKGVSANVDFYSGLVYRMLRLPYELYTPIFAISRIAGWSAHRIEEIQCAGKIIRPAYVNVKEPHNYISIDNR